MKRELKDLSQKTVCLCLVLMIAVPIMGTNPNTQGGSPAPEIRGEDPPEPLNGGCFGGSGPPPSGNWTVTQDTYCHNTTLTMYGNLTVYGTSPDETELILDNTTLIVDTAWNMTDWRVGNNTPSSQRYATLYINNSEIRRPYDVPLKGDLTKYYWFNIYGGIKAINSNISSIGQWKMFGTSGEARPKYFYNNTIQQSWTGKSDWQFNLPTYGLWDGIRFDKNTIWDNHTLYATQYWLRRGGGGPDFHFGNNTIYCGAPQPSFCPFTNRDPTGTSHYYSWMNRRASTTYPDLINRSTGVWNNFPDDGFDHYYEKVKIGVHDLNGDLITEPVTVKNGWNEIIYQGNSGIEFWIEALNESGAGIVRNYSMNPYSVTLDNYPYVKAVKFNGTQITRVVQPPYYLTYPDHYNQVNISAHPFWRMYQRKVMYRWDDLGYCVAYEGPTWYTNETSQEHIGHVEIVHDNITGSDVVTHAIVPAHQNCPNYPVELSEDEAWMTFINGLNGSFTDHTYAHIDPSAQDNYTQGQHMNASYNWSLSWLPERFYTWSAPSSKWNNYTELHIGNQFPYSKDYINLAGTEIGSHTATDPQQYNEWGLAGLKYTFHSTGFTSWVAGDNYPAQKWAYLDDFGSYPLYANFWTSMNHWWQMDNYADGSYNWTKWRQWNESLLFIDGYNVDYYTMNEYAKWSKNIGVADFSVSEGIYSIDCSNCNYNWTVKFTPPASWTKPRIWDIDTMTEIEWSTNKTEIVFIQDPHAEYVVGDNYDPRTEGEDGEEKVTTRSVIDFLMWLLILLFLLIILYTFMKRVQERFEREVQ